jgi:hypothetical protein
MSTTEDSLFTRASRAIRRSGNAHLAVVAAKWCALCCGPLALLAVGDWARSRVPIGTSSFGTLVVVSTVACWSLLSTGQRMTVIALVRHGGAASGMRRLRENRDALAKLALARALGHGLGLLATTAAVAVVLTRLARAGYVIDFGRGPYVVVEMGVALACFVLATAARGATGIVTAAIIAEDFVVTDALVASVRRLRGWRAAIVASRAGFTVAALAAGILFASTRSTLVAVLFVVMEPILVTLDAALEAAWYERVRPAE